MASTCARSRPGSTWSSLASVRTAASPRPSTVPPAASRRHTATATASASSSSSGGRRRPAPELVAAARAVGGVDRVAEVAQPFDVAAHAAGRDAQPVGELGAAPDRPALQQVEQPQHPGRGAGAVGRGGHVLESGSLCGQKLSYMAEQARAMTTTQTPIDWTSVLLDQAARHWTNQLRPRFEGLTDEEYFWEPTPGAWNVHPRGQGTTEIQGGSGELTIDFAYPEPVPAPFTTIAWRLAHIIVGVLGARVHSHFGGPAVDYLSFDYAGTADEALAQLDEALRRLDRRRARLGRGGPRASRAARARARGRSTRASSSCSTSTASSSTTAPRSPCSVTFTPTATTERGTSHGSPRPTRRRRAREPHRLPRPAARRVRRGRLRPDRGADPPRPDRRHAQHRRPHQARHDVRARVDRADGGRARGAARHPTVRSRSRPRPGATTSASRDDDTLE